MAKKLPKIIYVRWNQDSDEPWLEASDDPELLGEFGKGQIAGKYELKDKVKITHKTETTISTNK